MTVSTGKLSTAGLHAGIAMSAGGFAIQIVSGFEDWQSMSRIWNTLLNDSAAITLFLSWEWLYTWAKTYLNSDRSLYLICVYDANELVGVAPFYIQKVRRKLVTLREIRFLGSPEAGSDYLDVFMRKGREKAVAKALYDFLFGYARHQWDELHLTDIPAESLFLTHFVNCAEENGKFTEIQRCAVMPQTKLPATMDAFYSMLSANRREIFRRDMRRLNHDGRIEHITYCAANYENGLNRFFELYNLKSGHNKTKLHAFLKKLGAMHNAKQWLQIDILSTPHTDIAGLLHLRYEDNLSMLLMVVDKNFNHKISLGNLFIGMCMHKAIDEGIQTYDFLKGDEGYKFHWANNTRASLSVIIDQHHLSSILATIGRLSRYAVKTILR